MRYIGLPRCNPRYEISIKMLTDRNFMCVQRQFLISAFIHNLYVVVAGSGQPVIIP